MQPEKLLDRLLLLSLALEEALQREDFHEADGLFRQRDIALTLAQQVQIPKEHPSVRMILTVDARIGVLLATRSQQYASEFRKIQAQGRAKRAYGKAA